MYVYITAEICYFEICISWAIKGKWETLLFFSIGKLSGLCQRVSSLNMAHPLLCKTKYDLLSTSKCIQSKFIMITMNHTEKTMYTHLGNSFNLIKDTDKER